MKDVVVAWFEIPVVDMDRAKKFYEVVFNTQISIQDFGGVVMGWFPGSETSVGATGTLIKHESYVPNEKGTLVYFSCDDVQIELDRIEEAGGIIKQGKTMISPEHGYMAIFNDTEGNRVALYSKQ